MSEKMVLIKEEELNNMGLNIQAIFHTNDRFTPKELNQKLEKIKEDKQGIQLYKTFTNNLMSTPNESQQTITMVITQQEQEE